MRKPSTTRQDMLKVATHRHVGETFLVEETMKQEVAKAKLVRKVWLMFVTVFVVLLGACSQQPTPTTSEELAAQGTCFYNPSSWGVKTIKSSSSPRTDVALNVEVGPYGSVYVQGYTYGDVVSEGNDSGESFLYKYNSVGCIVWKTRVGVTSSRFEDLVVDSQGYAYVLGSRRNGDLHDQYLTKLSLNGNHLWIKKVKGDGLSSHLEISPLGYLVIVGVEENHYFVAYYNSAGNLIASLKDDRENGFIIDFTVDANGKMYIVGEGDNNTNSTNDDTFLDVYNASFSLLGRKDFGWDRAEKVTVDSSGNIFVSSFDVHDGSGYHLSKFSPALAQVWSDPSAGRIDALTVDSAKNVYIGADDVHPDTIIRKYPGYPTASFWTRVINSINGVRDVRVRDIATSGSYIYVVGQKRESSGSWDDHPAYYEFPIDGFVIRYDLNGNQR